MPKTYFTHDNGGRPFAVDIYSGKIDVVQMVLDDDGRQVRGSKKITVPYQKIFIGDKVLRDSRYSSGRGNSFLIELHPGVYVHVGREVFQFQTRGGERILKYFSPIGNNDVPYPYAVGENYTYFLLDDDHATVPNHVLDLKKDGYHQFYGHSLRDQPERWSVVDRSKRKFRVKKLLSQAPTKRRLLGPNISRRRRSKNRR